MKFVRIETEVDAIQWTDLTHDQVVMWLAPIETIKFASSEHLWFVYMGSEFIASSGDWILKFPDGRIQVMCDDQFKREYRS